MRCLTYRDLHPGPLAAKVDKVRQALERDDFRSPDVKKLHVGNYFRAKLDDASRLLLQFAEVDGQPVCLLLEVIAHHAYDKSRFLRGAVVDETKLLDIAPPAVGDRAPMRYVHPTCPTFLLLDKPLSLDDAQEAALKQRPPMLLVGSAGSGKTAVLLQCLRQHHGRVAYITESRWLAETSRSIYVAFDGAPDGQEADFLSYQQLLESIHVPQGRPVTFTDFQGFFARHQHKVRFADAHAVFEELRGVLTAEPEGLYSREAYLDLGVKQSLFDRDARAVLYDVFDRYQTWLVEQNLYEPNLIAHAQLANAQAAYDFIVVDEVQDLTNVQLALVLASLKSAGHFVLAGDANQIVHPNFFSWAKVKSLFWRGIGEVSERQVHTLAISYRNSEQVTLTANRLLQLKNLRFGSIDRESNRLMQAVGGQPGLIASVLTTSPAVRDIDTRTRQSTRTAVVVLRDADKVAARKAFGTPLIFSIHEAKGLEYETVILYRLVSAEREIYRELGDGVTTADLAGDELAYRRAKDKADKSLELYKFYVNALYVALTRAIRDVLLVEDDARHPLLLALGVEPMRDASQVKTTKASNEDWQREAQRLEAQGKREQADAIRKKVLNQQPVPWTTFDAANLPGLWQKAVDKKVVATKLRQQMLEFAYLHDEKLTVAHLQALTGIDVLDTYEQDRVRGAKEAIRRAVGKGNAEVLRDTERYGVDHRLQVGLTPLMLAAYIGDVGLVQALVDRGASRTARDHLGRMAVHWALRGHFDGRLFFGRPTSIGIIYDLVAPPSFDVEADGRLLQVGREAGEYLIFNLIVAFQSDEYTQWGKIWQGISAQRLRTRTSFDSLPENVLKEKRKKQNYLNHVLARACVGSTYTPCRQLWVRARQGEYVLNPNLRLRVSDASGDLVWRRLGEVMNTVWLDAHDEAVRKADAARRLNAPSIMPPRFTPAQAAAAKAMAPGISETDLRALRLTLNAAPKANATRDERERRLGLLKILDDIDRGVIGPDRITRS